MSAKNQSDPAKIAIKNYLDRRAAEDELFAESYRNEKKNIDECFQFILGEAKKRGSAVCMTDEEVFGLAVHYYDEKDLKVTPVSGYRKSAVQKVEEEALTEETKAAIEENVRKNYAEICFAKMQEERSRKAASRSSKKGSQEEPSLF